MTHKTIKAAVEEAAAEEIFPEGIGAEETPPESDPTTVDAVEAIDLPPVAGRALVDIPRLDLRCGQYGTVPAAELDALVAAGEFDPAAVLAETPEA